MSFRPMLKQRAVAPVAVSLLAGGLSLYPKRTVFAEEPRDLKKPIYDDLPDFPDLKPAPAPTPEDPPVPGQPQPEAPSKPTPTDVLTTQVRQARLFIYHNSLAVENSFNDFLSRALHVENAFTNTVASLAPSPESGENLLPSGVYAVVAAMAGSIVSRNRGIFLRTASPFAFGTLAAWSLLPVTMRNVSDLVWEYEKRAPAVAENHLQLREKTEHIWQTGVAHSGMARGMMEEKIGEGRKKLEELVSRGH